MDRLAAGAYEISGHLDQKWQRVRDEIEAYGRECYRLGALDLARELDGFCACVECAPAPAVAQADGSPEACS